MRVLPILLAGLLVAAWTQAAVASINNAAPQQQQKPAVAPAKTTAPVKAPEKGRTAAAPTKPADAQKKDEKAATGQGARAGIGQFEFMSPDAPPLRPGANVGRRLLAQPAPQQQKPAVAPAKTTAPVKAPEKGRTAAAPTKPADAKKDEKAATGQGARAGIGQFDFISPDAPPLRPGANVGRHLLAQPAPQQQKPAVAPAKTTAPVKAPEKGTKQDASHAQHKKDEKATTGQGARAGIGQFDFMAPDKPTLAPGGNVLSG